MSNNSVHLIFNFKEHTPGSMSYCQVSSDKYQNWYIKFSIAHNSHLDTNKDEL